MSYHVTRNDQQLGQYEQDALVGLIRQGQFLPGDLCWTEGMSEWQTLQQVFPHEFAGAASPPGIPAIPPTPVSPALGGTPPKIDNYLTQSILITLCCCLPFGIVAIVFSSQVNSKLLAGDIAGAQKASDNAKMWGWIGFGVGIVTNVIVILSQALVASQGAY